MYKWALVKKLKMEGLEIKLIASRLITELPRWFVNTELKFPKTPNEK